MWLNQAMTLSEYFFELLNYFDALNYKKNNINFITGTDKTPEKIKELSKVLIAAINIYEKEKNSIFMDACNRVKVLKFINLKMS